PPRQYRGELFVAADGGLSWPRDSDDEPEVRARSPLHAPSSLPGKFPVSGRRAARSDLAAKLPGGGANRGSGLSQACAPARPRRRRAQYRAERRISRRGGRRTDRHAPSAGSSARGERQARAPARRNRNARLGMKTPSAPRVTVTIDRLGLRG